MKVAISINNLYKEYKLGVIGRGTLYRDLQSWWALKKGKEDPNSLIGHSDAVKYLQKNKKSNHLALDNINLDINEGEVIGIIGANGAGKSTLLKILSRVTSPTKGQINIKGKISSLLEVGTGFHPELTGRENIFLNGAINGMSKKEISGKLNDIVNFAGVEKFLDTPVKRYSSGMHVRLGFAVAAHLEPDILIVDEVLAVGDADFQKRAIKKMKDVSSDNGRTVIFVSHNMESIRKLCSRVIVMGNGKIIYDGTTEDSINEYIGGLAQLSRTYKNIKWDNIKDAPGGDIVRLKSVSILDEKNNLRDKFKLDENIIVECDFEVLKDGFQVSSIFSFGFYSSKTFIWSGEFFLLDDYKDKEWGKQKSFKLGIYRSKLTLPKNILNEGVYSVSIDIFLPPSLPDMSFQARIKNVVYFEIIDDIENFGARGSYPGDWQQGSGAGYLIRPVTNFETKKIENINKG